MENNNQPQGGFEPQSVIPPKKPMSPKTKKMVILICAIGGGVLVLGLVALIVLPIILKVDYKTSYAMAKELQEQVEDIEYSNDCEWAVMEVDDRYVSEKDFNEYADGCLDMGSGLTDKLKQLGESSGVSGDAEIRAKFDEFMVKYGKTIGDRAAIEKAIPIYKVWHKYLTTYRVNMTGWRVEDSKVKATFGILIDSGVDELSKFGTAAQEKYLAATAATKKYEAASYSDANWSELYDAVYDTRDAYNDYVDESQPEVAELYPIEAEDVSGLTSSWSTFYRALADMYEQNYDEGDGLCTSARGKVYCD